MGTPEERSSSWVSSFLSTPYGDYLCHIEDEYIRDRFNLTYLDREVTNFRKAYEMILGDHFDDDHQNEAIKLYGLIHARYILSPAGLPKMYTKYRQSSFGACPRVLCDNYPVLPVGISDRPGQGSVRLFCPKCRDIYVPRNKRAQAFDGAWFGTSFPHFLLQTYKENTFLNEEKVQYVPKIFGFKLAN